MNAVGLSAGIGRGVGVGEGEPPADFPIAAGIGEGLSVGGVVGAVGKLAFFDWTGPPLPSWYGTGGNLEAADLFLSG